MPPLRSRGTDILLLAQHFVETFRRRRGREVDGDLASRWPRSSSPTRGRATSANCATSIERAVALTRYDKLAVEDLPEKIRDYSSRRCSSAATIPRNWSTLEEVERRYILHVLETVGGNKTLASRILGLDRKTLYRKLQQYGENVEQA